jgi:hypothetical protein
MSFSVVEHRPDQPIPDQLFGPEKATNKRICAMTPDVALFAIRGLVRVGAATRDAYAQKVRDRDILLPNIPTLDRGPMGLVLDLFQREPHGREVEPPHGRLAEVWLKFHSGNEQEHEEAARQLLAEAEAIWSLDPPDDAHLRFEESAYIWALEQFAPAAGPVSPFARVCIAVADVVLDYIGANPGLLGVGGNGERLVAALAGNLHTLLPDPDATQPTGAHFFAERALTIVLQAGLKTIGEETEHLFSETHLRDLTTALAKPLIDAFAGAESGRVVWTDLRDTLLGPMTQAALQTLGLHQRAFLGKRFDPEGALGAVTRSMLQVASDRSLRETLTDNGLIRLYRAALGVAAERPELFVRGEDDRFARALLLDVAEAARGAAEPFGRSAVPELAAAVLEAAGRNVGLLTGQRRQELTHAAALRVLDVLAKGLHNGLSTSGEGGQIRLDRLFSDEQRLALMRLLTNALTKTPELLLDEEQQLEHRAIVAAVARAVGTSLRPKGGSDAALENVRRTLLDAGEWLKVAAVILDEAYRNPERLVARNQASERQLAVQVVTAVLDVAANTMSEDGRANGAVLFGETLRDIMIAVLRIAAIRAGPARQNLAAIARLIEQLNAFVSSNRDQVGQHDLMLLFQRHVVQVVVTGELPPLSNAALVAELEIIA